MIWRSSRRSLGWRAGIAIAVVIALVGVVLSARQATAVFLVAYTAAVSVVLGVLAIFMIAHLTTASWFAPYRRQALRIIGLLPTLAIFGVLLIPATPVLYSWAGPRGDGAPASYLNVLFFALRFVVYWAAWLLIARALRATQAIEVRDPERAMRRYRRLSASGLIILGFTMTFAAFDWMMSLTPDWYSTIYGLYWFAGGMTGALALLAVVTREPENADEPRVTPEDVHALAKLLLTFILFWLYIGFAQYIVIWSAGIPREVTWYVTRTRGGWGNLAAILIVGNFVLPFLLLLLRSLKRSRSAIAALGVVLLVLHYLDTAWVVLPGLVPITAWCVLLAAAMLIVLMVALYVPHARS